MGADHPPARFLREAGLIVLPEEIRPREGRAWLVGWQGTRGVLRRLPVPVTLAADLAHDVTWLHGFMTRLAGAGFPSPRPLPCFDGMSWIMAGGWLWEIVSFLPGHAVGWAAVPPMEEVGALLARYHMAVRQIPVTSQRPAALPLTEVPPVLLSHQLDAIPPERAAPIRQLAAQLARDLNDTDHLELPRVRRFLRGYASVVRISPDQASIIPLYVWGRGLQMIAKRVRAGRNDTAMLAQVQWVTANAGEVVDALVAALP